MALQSASHNKSRFVQLATSGMLILQTTIVTTVISAVASTNSGWLSVSSASAQEAQPSVPVPGSVSTSTESLKPTPIVIDCSTVTELPIPNCRPPVVLPDDIGPELPHPGLDPGMLLDAQRDINQNAPSNTRLEVLPVSGGVKLQLRFPLP